MVNRQRRKPGIVLASTGPDQCMATAKMTGKRCLQTPVPGSVVCRFHGGLIPRTARKAAAQDAVDKLYQGDATPVGDPFRELARIAGVLQAAVADAGRRVNELSEIRYTSDGNTEQLRAEVALWERLIKTSSGVLADMVRLGIEERAVKVEEQTAEVFITLIRAVFADPELGLSREQVAASGRVASRHLLAALGPDGIYETTAPAELMPSLRGGASSVNHTEESQAEDEQQRDSDGPEQGNGQG